MFKNRGTIVLDGMVVYEDLQVSSAVPRRINTIWDTKKKSKLKYSVVMLSL
jgi:hypothetical protein